MSWLYEFGYICARSYQKTKLTAFNNHRAVHWIGLRFPQHNFACSLCWYSYSELKDTNMDSAGILLIWISWRTRCTGENESTTFVWYDTGSVKNEKKYMGTHTGAYTARRSNNFFILFRHHNNKYGYIVYRSFLIASQLTHTRHKHFNKYKEHNRESHAPNPRKHTYHKNINTRQERTSKTYTGRRATYNYYTPIKHKKPVYKHLIFNFND